MNLKFRDCTYVLERNEASFKEVFQDAILDAMSPEYRPDERLELNEAFVFKRGDSMLDVAASKPYSSTWLLTRRR